MDASSAVPSLWMLRFAGPKDVRCPAPSASAWTSEDGREAVHARSVRVSFAVFGRSPWFVAGYMGSVDCYTDCCRLTWPPPLTSLVIY